MANIHQLVDFPIWNKNVLFRGDIHFYINSSIDRRKYDAPIVNTKSNAYVNVISTTKVNHYVACMCSFCTWYRAHRSAFLYLSRLKSTLPYCIR